ncbi:MAG: hypothetical protein GMKNLPBB_00004 [Myxococcota bacterium]|nr:hypothetical protein [Myxococcota bacterium]
MKLLLISIASNAVGPILHGWFRKNIPMLALLDGFVCVSVGGLVFGFILPETFQHAGLWALASAAAGMMALYLLERSDHGPACHGHEHDGRHHRPPAIFSLFALLALAAHAFADGVGLGGYTPGTGEYSGFGVLPLAVVLHRAPVGMTLWWLIQPSYGTSRAMLVLAVDAVATVMGYALASHVAGGMNPVAFAMAEAAMGGMLMHVVLHQTHPLIGHLPPRQRQTYTGAGAAAAMVFLAVTLISLGDEEQLAPAEFAGSFLALAMESAPALLLAYVMAGLIHAFLPAAPMNWLARGGKSMQAMKGMIFGLPLPICSCGVVPLYQTLIKRGAPPAAAMAFLVATPELGVDAALLSLPLLGPELTMGRLAAAAGVAFLAGLLLGGRIPRAELSAAGNDTWKSGGTSFRQRLRKGLVEGTMELVDHTGPWVLLGLTIAALAEPLLHNQQIFHLPAGMDVPLFALLGMPVYVCASGATPLAAVLIYNGVSPGAALAFLLTGPATNITTFGVLNKLHGRKTAIHFGLLIAGLSIGAGWLINWLLPSSGIVSLHDRMTEAHPPLQVISLVLLGALFLLSLFRLGPRGLIEQLFTFDHSDHGHAHAHDGHRHSHHDLDGGDIHAHPPPLMASVGAAPAVAAAVLNGGDPAAHDPGQSHHHGQVHDQGGEDDCGCGHQH